MENVSVTQKSVFLLFHSYGNRIKDEYVPIVNEFQYMKMFRSFLSFLSILNK